MILEILDTEQITGLLNSHVSESEWIKSGFAIDKMTLGFKADGMTEYDWVSSLELER